MSNFLAISAVTASIAYLLTQGNIGVTAKPPDTQTASNAQINIFLYQVLPNLGYKNLDLPARNLSGTEIVRKQQLGLDLHYLLTAYGEGDNELSAQKILAETVVLLHEHPVLNRELIALALAHPPETIGADGVDLTKSDLANQLELVKLSMMHMSLEDLTKIWTSFFKTKPYRISVAYKATVVLLDGASEPLPTMPVRKVNSYAFTSPAPHITYVEPQMVPWAAGGAEIKLMGKNLEAETVKIDFGEGLDLDKMPQPIVASANELVVKVPETLSAGVKQVRVLHPLSIGSPQMLHRGGESNTALFAIVPVITEISPTSLAVGNKLTVEFKPLMSSSENVQVIIRNYKPLKVDSLTPGEDGATTSKVEVTIPSGYEKGIDLPLRVRVANVESQPDEKLSNDHKRPVVRIIA
jgi:hypothetical protein